jgi:hypothetical protein
MNIRCSITNFLYFVNRWGNYRAIIKVVRRFGATSRGNTRNAIGGVSRVCKSKKVDLGREGRDPSYLLILVTLAGLVEGS